MNEKEALELVMTAFDADKTMAEEIIKWWTKNSLTNHFFNRTLLKDKGEIIFAILERFVNKKGIDTYHLEFYVRIITDAGY